MGSLLSGLLTVLGTKHQIATERAGSTEATTMLQRAKNVNAEQLIILKMMVDASGEGLCLVRSEDDACTDVASLRYLVVGFLERTEMFVCICQTGEAASCGLREAHCLDADRRLPPARIGWGLRAGSEGTKPSRDQRMSGADALLEEAGLCSDASRVP